MPAEVKPLSEAAEKAAMKFAMETLERGCVPLRVQLVTSNPVGRQNMRAALEGAGYTTKDGVNFVATPQE